MRTMNITRLTLRLTDRKLRRFLTILVALAAAGCTGRQAVVTPSAARMGRACVTILSTNDTHGQIVARAFPATGREKVGGVAALATYFHRVREESAECPVLLLSGGDVMQGTPISNLVQGESTIAAFNALGYDAAAVGNHEFDWGIEVLQQRIAQAHFPFLGANVTWKGTDEHPAWLPPYRIVERGGVRVGVIGLATVSTPTTTHPKNVVALDFHPISQTLDRVIPEVRARGVDFVVVVMHAGGFCRPSSGCEGEAIQELQKTTARFDYAVTGHTHTLVKDTIHGAPVIQSRSSTRAFGVGRIERDASGQVRRTLIRVRIPFADSVAPDSAIAVLVGRYEAEVAEVAERPIVRLARALPDAGQAAGDFPLGRLIADAQRAATGDEVSIMNNGGIRTGLPAGTVTYGDLFQVQPFQNTLVRLRLGGRALLATLEHALEEGGPRANVSGVRVRYDAGAPKGHRILEVTLDDGRAVNSDSSYRVTANNFMVAGGSGYTDLQAVADPEDTGIVDLEALIDYLAARPQPVVAPAAPRWIATREGESGPDRGLN